MRVVLELILCKLCDLEGVSFETSFEEVDLNHRRLGVVIVICRHIVVHMRHNFAQERREVSHDVAERVVVNLTSASANIESRGLLVVLLIKESSQSIV